jgi:hypothetical protein
VRVHASLDQYRSREFGRLSLLRNVRSPSRDQRKRCPVAELVELARDTSPWRSSRAAIAGRASSPAASRQGEATSSQQAGLSRSRPIPRSPAAREHDACIDARQQRDPARVQGTIAMPTPGSRVWRRSRPNLSRDRWPAPCRFRQRLWDGTACRQSTKTRGNRRGHARARIADRAMTRFATGTTPAARPGKLRGSSVRHFVATITSTASTFP